MAFEHSSSYPRGRRIEMQHGAGGRASARLIEELFVRYFSNPWLDRRDDQATFAVDRGRMVMSTDAHVVSPLFFPGGDIGALSVHGTINDVCMSGAVPRFLSASFVLEEGFPIADLRRIVRSMATACEHTGVPIVTGDTKVVERGKADGMYITTTGIGEIPEGVDISCAYARPGDHVLVSGRLGDHGVAILSARDHLGFDCDITSDSAALSGLVATMVDAVPGIRSLRDPTRGGLATVLNEIADQSRVGMCVRECDIPVHDTVRSACELLGLDPFYLANEGKLVAICKPEDSSRLLASMQAHPLGREARIIGEVVEAPTPFVELTTAFGGRRMLDWMTGDPLPRIC